MHRIKRSEIGELTEEQLKKILENANAKLKYIEPEYRPNETYYHHGESALNDAIGKMRLNFPIPRK